MEVFLIVIFLLFVLGVAIYLWIKKGTVDRQKLKAQPFPEVWEKILLEKVKFYKNLNEVGKEKFKNHIKVFLHEVRITGVKTTVDDTTKLLLASSAVIPIFSFEDWEYLNLHEVLVYDSLINTYEIMEAGLKNRVLGQVKSFQARHLLLISKESLEKGFESMNGKENVGLHEFAHLIDEADGAIDGIPKSVLPPDLIQPWTSLMYKEMNRIKRGKSDINPYGLTNPAEFFAVVSEYFFEAPEKFQQKHPELHQIMSKAFKRKLM